MTCDKYKNALLSAAASNEELEAKLARHIEHCSTCRLTLNSERELFSQIDSTLRAQMKEGPSAGFLAQLRFQISNDLTIKPGSNRTWHVAGAALALVLIAALYTLVNARQSNVEGSLEPPTIALSRIAEATPSVSVGKVSGPNGSKRPAAQRATQNKPEVLVPPDEQKAFAQFVACVGRRDAVAQAVVTPAANRTLKTNTELPQVSFVDVAALQLNRAREKEWINQSGSSE